MFASSTRSRSRHTLLIQMARDAEKLAAQAERLRALKQISRVKFKAIAEAVNVTERQVQRWFAGDSDIEPDNLKALAQFLGTSPDYIEYGEIGRGSTPDLLKKAGQLDRIEDKLDQVLALLTRSSAEDRLVAELEEDLPQRLAEAIAPPQPRAPSRSSKNRAGTQRRTA